MKKLIAGGIVTALTTLALASPAVAASHHPTGEFAPFGECPLNRATITDCIYSVTNGGSFTIGKKTVPIVNPVTLQGGFEGEGSGLSFFGAENGDTLSKTPQPVPGGLLGLLNCPAQTNPIIKGLCEVAFENGLTGVNAVVELAAPATSIQLNTENLVFEVGTALQLPVKVHLENPTLGNKCYLGSDSNPILIPFTTGTSGSLHGAAGEFVFNEEFTLITISGGKLVNNTFAAPATTGCGGLLSLLVNPVVNLMLGTPAGSGSNFATLEGKLQDGAAFAVRESE